MLSPPPPTMSTSAPGRCGEMRGDRAPAVGDVVARAGERGGRDPGGRGDQHRVGEGHAHEVGRARRPSRRRRRRSRTSSAAARSCSRRSGPRRQRAQAPQEIWKGTTTRSPGATARTSSPTSATSATNSWPRAIGPGIGASPRRIGWSRSQSATASGRTSASPGPWSAGAGTSHHSTCRSAVIVSCCISPPGVAGVRAAGARPRAARRHSAGRGPARARPRARRW